MNTSLARCVWTAGLSALLINVVSLHAVADDAKPAAGSIAEKLQPFVEHHTLAGAVAIVATKDKVLSVDAVGFADVAAKKPMRPDSLFWIASMSKPITGAALMILVDEGKVKVDDPVEKYLPEFKDLWLAVERDKEHILLKKPQQSVIFSATPAACRSLRPWNSR